MDDFFCCLFVRRTGAADNEPLDVDVVVFSLGISLQNPLETRERAAAAAAATAAGPRPISGVGRTTVVPPSSFEVIRMNRNI